MDAKSKLINEFTTALSTFKTDDMREAIRKLTLILNDYEVQPKCTDLVTVDTESEKLLKKFLATKRLEGRSENTLEIYRYVLKRFLDEIQIPIKDVDVYALRLYMARKEQEGSSASTINWIRSIFCSFFGWLFSEGFIDRNPADNLKAVKCRKEIRTPFNNTEIELLRKHCRNPRDRALIEFLLSTGCRIEETVNVKMEDMDFHTQECKVLGKGNKERMVYLSDVAVFYIKAYVASRKDSSPYLFVSQRADHIKTDAARIELQKVAELAGVENVHPHRFRRTLATSLINKGMPIQDVAAILGHSNINTTMTYIYLNKDSVKANYKKLVS